MERSRHKWTDARSIILITSCHCKTQWHCASGLLWEQVQVRRRTSPPGPLNVFINTFISSEAWPGLPPGYLSVLLERLFFCFLFWLFFFVGRTKPTLLSDMALSSPTKVWWQERNVPPYSSIHDKFGLFSLFCLLLFCTGTSTVRTEQGQLASSISKLICPDFTCFFFFFLIFSSV